MLTARSVLLSVLLGTDPPRLPVRRLVRTTMLFGIAEGTTRTALSRMAAAGEVVATDGWYALAAGRHLARRARQEASRRAETLPWPDGRWAQAVVVADGRREPAERAALRSALRRARLAELREGVWMRPANLAGLPPSRPPAGRGESRDESRETAGEVRGDESREVSREAGRGERRDVGREEATAGEPGRGDDVAWFLAVPEGEPTALAARLWDLPGWAEASHRLVERMAALVPPLESGDPRPLAEGFVLSAEVLRQLQADPLLPAELLPAAWPGRTLRADYDRYDAAYRAVLADWLATTD